MCAVPCCAVLCCAVCCDADEDLVKQTKSWTIVGQDLIKEVTCKEPYHWQDPTGEEWEFAEEGESAPSCAC